MTVRSSRRTLLAWLAALGVSAAADADGARADYAEEPLMPASGSDVGSLYPFIRSQVTDGEPRLSFLRDEFGSLRQWKRRGQARLLDLLHYAPRKCAPAMKLLGRVDRDDHIEERIEFSTTPDIRTPAYLLLTKGAKGPAPAVVALHDHGGFYLWGKEKLIDLPGESPHLTAFKRQYYAGRSVATELVRRGYVVIVIDMFYWGDRRMLLDDDADDWRQRPADISNARVQAYNRRAGDHEDLVGRTIAAAGFTWPGVMVWDDIRTVDYLVTRPEVDPKRIGCIGLSVGGLRSCHLAALDDRIKAAVVVGWMASFSAQLKSHIRYTIGASMLVPGLYHDLDYPDVASLAMPTPLLVINGKRDTLFELAGVHACFDKLTACYAKAGAPRNVRTLLFDTPHEFNEEMQSVALEWLGRHLAPT